MPFVLHHLANPGRFLRLADAVLPTATVLCLGLTGAGLWFALVASPSDYQQGETVRIMYVHVPAAWMALGAWAGMAVASAIGLVWRHPVALIGARCTAPVGAAFTVVALATGSLWGQPMWGTWWVWDARLTSVLILLFLYLGHMALTESYPNPETGERAAAILALAGAVNLPVIKFSVDWWNTLHQPASILRAEGPSIHADMLLPLFLMAAGFALLLLVVILVRMQTELARRRTRALHQARLFRDSESGA